MGEHDEHTSRHSMRKMKGKVRARANDARFTKIRAYTSGEWLSGG